MKLAEYLEKYSLSQSKFSNLIDVDQAAISQYITQKRTPHPDIMKRIHEVTKGAVTFADWYVKDDYERLRFDIRELNVTLAEISKWLGKRYTRQTIKSKLQNANFSKVEFRSLRIRLDKLLANLTIDYNYDDKLIYIKDVRATYKIPGKILQYILGISQAGISQRLNKDIKFTDRQINVLYAFMQECQSNKGSNIIKIAEKFVIKEDC